MRSQEVLPGNVPEDLSMPDIHLREIVSHNDSQEVGVQEPYSHSDK